MQDNFRESMRFIYPNGTPPNKHQWRDLCKVYVMGWIDSAHSHEFNDPDAIAVAKMMTNFNWWPDDTWRWG